MDEEIKWGIYIPKRGRKKKVEVNKDEEVV